MNTPLHMDDLDHVFEVTETYPGIVAAAVAADSDMPYRPADPGEPVIVVEWQEARCECGATDRSWSRAR